MVACPSLPFVVEPCLMVLFALDLPLYQTLLQPGEWEAFYPSHPLRLGILHLADPTKGALYLVHQVAKEVACLSQA